MGTELLAHHGIDVVGDDDRDDAAQCGTCRIALCARQPTRPEARANSFSPCAGRQFRGWLSPGLAGVQSGRNMPAMVT